MNWNSPGGRVAIAALISALTGAITVTVLAFAPEFPEVVLAAWGSVLLLSYRVIEAVWDSQAGSQPTD